MKCLVLSFALLLTMACGGGSRTPRPTEMRFESAIGGGAADAPCPAVPCAAKGSFVQRKILADVDVTLVSKGEFRFEKDRFFEWKVVSPVPSLFYATPTNWTLTVRGKSSVHPLNVDVSSFEKVFEIKEMQEFVEGVELSPKVGFPEKVNVKFKNGDRLEIDMAQSR